ncbi:MAG TPA: energy transducer TonB [Pyrinomonadaceae bacterium]|nr:energy transducer TonB [Pyrinomonadaceae bacterium]
MNRFGTTKLTASTILTLLAASILSPSDNVVGQQKTITSYRGSTVMVLSYAEIPEATEQCSQEEKQWWESLRKAGNDLQKKRDKKSQMKLGVLFAEGLGKGYRIPLKDRPPQVLVHGRVVFPESLVARARIKGLKGSIDLSIEYRADGSIGDVKILKGLDKDMDAYAVQGARESIFIPAIKDGTFVTDWQNSGLKFSTQRN